MSATRSTKHRRTPPRILLALDATEAAQQAANVARDLFGAEAEYLAINVAHPSTAWTLGGAGYGGVLAVPPDGILGSVGLKPEEVELIALTAGLENVEVLSDAGDPADRICATAEDRDVDVIVVGAHTRGLLARLLDPPVAAGVVRRAKAPVLVVRDDE